MPDCGSSELEGYSAVYAVVQQNTIVNNKSATSDSAARGMKGRGGALIAAGTKVVFRNNIVWGNSQSAGNQVSYSPLTPPEIELNLVQGGAPGTGNLDKDPKFAGDHPLHPGARFAGEARRCGERRARGVRRLWRRSHKALGSGCSLRAAAGCLPTVACYCF